MSAASGVLWAAALAVPLLTAAGVWLFVRRRRTAARALGDPALARRLMGVDLAEVPWPRVLAVVAAAVVIGIGLTDPRWGLAAGGGVARGAPLVAVVDVSNSMLARDGAPDRLALARAALRRTADRANGRPIGIVVFAGQAVALTPPTTDRSALDLYIDALHPNMVTQTGSSVAPALRQGLALLTAGDGGGVLLLVSDGDATAEGGMPVEIARIAGRNGIPVYTAGTGTAAGAPVPDIDFQTGRQLGFKMERDGRTAISRLNERLLEGIALESGGVYVPLRDDASLDLLASTLAAAAARGRGGPPDEREPRFAWFAAAALLLLAAEVFLRHAPARGTAAAAALLLICLPIAGCRPAPQTAPDAEADERLVADLRASVQSEPASARARYNLGTALLIQARFDEARAELEHAAASPDSLVRQYASYNLGNSDLSPVFEGVERQDREERLRRAIEAYKEALLVDPADAHAKWNLELARRLLHSPEPPPPPDPTPDAGDGGGGGGGDGGTADPLPQPSAAGGGTAPRMSPEAAAQILSSAQERELATQQDKLARPQPRDPYAH
jgi:Ca-activated chloride channel homolog